MIKQMSAKMKYIVLFAILAISGSIPFFTNAIPTCFGYPAASAEVTGISTVDCAWAEMDAQSKAYALTPPCENYCRRWFQVIDDNNCNKYWPEGEFRVTGRARYTCEN